MVGKSTSNNSTLIGTSSSFNKSTKDLFTKSKKVCDQLVGTFLLNEGPEGEGDEVREEAIALRTALVMDSLFLGMVSASIADELCFFSCFQVFVTLEKYHLYIYIQETER